MSDELDPEVLADLQLRASSQRDRTRSRGDGVYSWSPPKIVGRWPCSTPVCSTLVEVTEDTMERWAMFNQVLRARGDDPLETGKILRCDTCKAELAKSRAPKLRDRVDQMAALIRELRAGCSGEREREITEQLRKWHHPDVPALVQAIADRRKASKRGRMESL